MEPITDFLGDRDLAALAYRRLHTFRVCMVIHTVKHPA
jgi:hypothetical protein